MGVVNITPDSFSDGGRDTQESIKHAFGLIEEGADIVDIGAESSRPGAVPVPATDEIARLMPVLRALRDAPVPVSIDTMKPEVMRAMIAEGATFINDINALRSDGALQAVADSDAGVCLMHMRGDPASMQNSPSYKDVVAQVAEFLAQRVVAAEGAGIARERISIDPGFGFGKTVEHNMCLLRDLNKFASLGLPVLFGASRKSTLGALTGRPVTERVPASVAAAMLALERGASILRVHDVAPTRDALAVWLAMRGETVKSMKNTQL
ncbi:MAG: dihydropteroate synthase [Betaproteobacteria bacterium]|nr:dihydropteroate synthase [Betaproteobacteria bacterium]